MDIRIQPTGLGEKPPRQRKDPSIARRSDTKEKISRISKISALRRGKRTGSMDFRRRRGENKGIARGERRELDLWITARRAGRKTAAQRKDPSIARRSDTKEKISRINNPRQEKDREKISKISAVRRGKNLLDLWITERSEGRKKPRQRPISPGSSPTSSPPRCRYCPLRRHFRAPWCPAGG